MRSLGRARILLAGALAVFAGILLMACESGAYPFDIFPEMHYQQSNRPGEPPLVQQVDGSVPTTGRESVLEFAQLSEQENPAEATLEAIVEGQELFRVNCAMCHGAEADGVSQVAPRFVNAGVRAPPNLREGLALVSPDGWIFAVITHGIGNMPSQQRLLTPSERWAIVNYLRSLQAADRVEG